MADKTICGFSAYEQDLHETLLAYMDIAETLRLVLPLARGYAAEHRVGSNLDYINSAEAALEKVEGRGQ
jgi:hypothetical protein